MTELSFCLPVEPPPQGGGGFRFLRGLERYLTARRIPWTRSPWRGARVLLLNSWQTGVATALAAAWARPDVTIVHRIDGAAQDYGRAAEADRRQARIDRIADLAIFQSEYCRYATREKYAVIGRDGPVIHNPVDIDTFRPDGPSVPLPDRNGPRVCAVSWSTNPMKGAADVYRVAIEHPEVQVVLCGRFPDAPDLPNVVARGVLDTEDLAATLRSCDVLVTFARNEACPNHVLEALACGLPVLYVDSGATAEIVGDCGQAITVRSFDDGLQRVLKERDALSARARERARRQNSPRDVYTRYLHVIGQALRPREGRLSRLAELSRRILTQDRSSL